MARAMAEAELGDSDGPGWKLLGAYAANGLGRSPAAGGAASSVEDGAAAAMVVPDGLAERVGRELNSLFSEQIARYASTAAAGAFLDNP